MLFNPINNFKVLDFMKEREIEHSIVPLTLKVTYIRLEYGGMNQLVQEENKDKINPEEKKTIHNYLTKQK